MGHYHPVAEEQFWSQPEKVWKRNGLGPTAVSQGKGSLHIEHLSHSGHDANQDSEWGAWCNPAQASSPAGNTEPV